MIVYFCIFSILVIVCSMVCKNENTRNRRAVETVVLGSAGKIVVDLLVEEQVSVHLLHVEVDLVQVLGLHSHPGKKRKSTLSNISTLKLFKRTFIFTFYRCFGYRESKIST